MPPSNSIKHTLIADCCKERKRINATHYTSSVFTASRIHARVYIHMHDSHLHSCIRAYMHVPVHMHETCTHARIHTYMHKNMYLHTCLHIRKHVICCLVCMHEYKHVSHLCNVAETNVCAKNICALAHWVSIQKHLHASEISIYNHVYLVVNHYCAYMAVTATVSS